ncbi:hypothetical protein [Halobellus ordinarius]|uniref:hypothetical protein n=1 Tax=Halobellus ordinarius TaxID=3075120 RepID=UPI002880BB93|nr:hypothetical protein [Halobellus sp. ZY16]
MAAEQTISRALRMLEAIYLLLPIVAILLQSMVRFYAEDESVTDWEKSKAFLIAIGGYALLVVSAGAVLVTLSAHNVDTFLFLAAVGSLVGLVFFGMAVFYLVSHVMTEEGRSPKDERTHQSKLETENDGGKND